MAREWENYVANVLDAMRVRYAREVHFGLSRADFVLVGLDIVIEIDGPEHASERKKSADKKKDEMYRNSGFTVLRISNRLLEEDIDAAIGYLISCIHRRQDEYNA